MRYLPLVRQVTRVVVGTAARAIAEASGRVQAERDLLHQILDDLREGVMVVDSHGRLLRANRSAHTMLGLGREAVGIPLDSTVGHRALAEALGVTERHRPDSQSLEFELDGSSGARLLVRASPLTGERGALLVVLVDVTEVRRLETVRRDFVANVSHELRTPVTVVVSAAETLRELLESPRDQSADLARWVSMIERNADRLRCIIDDLLELSRIEARRLTLRMQCVPVGPLVDSVLSTFSARAEARGVSLSRGGEEVSAHADPSGLERILANLVDNAIKYAPGAPVEVCAFGQRGRIQIEVRDCGPGIDARHLPRLFERFYRVDTARSRELVGTGLGLAIVRHMVEAMGGTVEVSSVVGEGTTFCVVLERS